MTVVKKFEEVDDKKEFQDQEQVYYLRFNLLYIYIYIYILLLLIGYYLDIEV